MQRSLFIRHGQHFQPQSSLANSQTTSQGREARVWEDFFILRKITRLMPNFIKLKALWERMEGRFIHMPSQIYVFEP